MSFVYLAFGMAFGFLLNRAGATEYDYYVQLFLFKDLQLLEVIGSAVTVGAIGIFLLKKNGSRTLFTKEPINFDARPFRKGLIVGAFIFGMGWGSSGSCPGSVIAMLGEGKLGSLPTIIGIVLGTWLYSLGYEAIRDAKQPMYYTMAAKPTWKISIATVLQRITYRVFISRNSKEKAE